MYDDGRENRHEISSGSRLPQCSRGPARQRPSHVATPARRAWWLAAALLPPLLLATRAAAATTCVVVDEARDGLADGDRDGARTLLEEALAAEGVSVAREGCSETWTVYHVRLGDTVTAVLQSPQGTRRERVKTLDDLPALYVQMVRALRSGAEVTSDGTSVDRRNVTETQAEPRRVRADAIWYGKLGYGATPASGFHSGPAFGFGRRWELDRIGINFGFLNFILYQDSDEFEGSSMGLVELGADYFFNAYANHSAYVGAGLSLGGHSIPEPGGSFDGFGLQGRASFGYEMLRASTIRLFAQLDATLPMYRLSRERVEAGVEVTEHVYSPTFSLGLGLGWGR